ncbi:MAG: GntR family transcriptional regulator [Vicinamibacteria bacterium]|nr:GntR family transcriptional regulator [Vicinamibacteria bacterium]
MGIIINRSGGVAVHDQLVTQIELKILGGRLQPGERLPSVRSLARRLNLHANTVSAAYQDLRAAGLLQIRRGAGIYVASGGPKSFEEARSLDEMIRLALQFALRRGFRASEIRAAVSRWMAAAPPERLAVVDPVPEAASLIAREVADVLDMSVAVIDPESLRENPRALDGALGLALPYHVERLKEAHPDATFEVLHLEVRDEDREAVRRLPAGSIVLVVSCTRLLLPFASVIVHSLRGDEVLIETATLQDRSRWKRLCGASDLVFADILSFPTVRKAGPKCIREFRLVSPLTIENLSAALDFIIPRSGADARED